MSIYTYIVFSKYKMDFIKSRIIGAYNSESASLDRINEHYEENLTNGMSSIRLNQMYRIIKVKQGTKMELNPFSVKSDDTFDIHIPNTIKELIQLIRDIKVNEIID